MLAGFSFGSFVQTRVAQRIAAERVVLVGPAVNRFAAVSVPPETLVVHGEYDDVVPLKDVLDVYASRSVERLTLMRDRDEEIDAMYTSLFRELLTYMMEDPRNITACTHLLFCAKNLERIGDHVTNIAENAYYVMTGTQLPPHRPKIDETGMTAER